MSLLASLTLAPGVTVARVLRKNLIPGLLPACNEVLRNSPKRIRFTGKLVKT